jgi:phosphatidylglycerol:prolipoprotein diacylglycerol transferase
VVDIIAPSIALGLCLGRVGCLLNGCCYGHVACPHCLGISFPMSAPPRFELVAQGYQSAAGFTMAPVAEDPRTVANVEPSSPAARASMILLFFLLTAFYPFKRNDGEVAALLMICYSVHRYLNEILRNDLRPEGFEKYSSFLLFGAGLAIFLWLRFRPAQYPPPATSPAR